MNKSDFKLIFVVLVISIVFIIGYRFLSKSGGEALVYHDGVLVKRIDLSIDADYVVDGDNGDVLILVRDGKIKVDDETSPLHLCSRQGYISDTHESIVCLPNRIVINISGEELDAVVK